MSTLKEVLNTITESESRLFGGQYSSITDKFYEPETDHIDEGITGMDGKTQQVFNLHIEALRNYGRLVNVYRVRVRYFKLMEAEATVPGAELLNFLLHTKIVVSKDQTISFQA